VKLSAKAIRNILLDWFRAWDDHDLNGVMALFHDDILFENWTGGRAQGKEALCKAWYPWFEDHGNFKFTEEDLFIDEAAQKVLYRWSLEWPSRQRGFEGRCERRRGVDVLHFRNGKIIEKLTYSKTVIEIDDQWVSLRASPIKDYGVGI
jgi:ketosteroid isomerase-like protein